MSLRHNGETGAISRWASPGKNWVNVGNTIFRFYKKTTKIQNGTLSEVYFIRYNRHAGWNETNTNFPFYTESKNKEFVQACDDLLADKLITLQWWEEDRAEK